MATNRRPLLTLVVGSVLASWSSFGAEPADAFLSRGEDVALVAAEQLSVDARAALAHGLVTSTERRLGVPTFFWAGQPAPGTRTPKSMGLTAEQVARRALFTHAEAYYRGDRVRWAEARLSKLHQLPDDGVVIATFQQDIKGVSVFRDEVKVALTKDFVLVALAGYLTPETRPLATWNLSASSAVLSALTSMTGRGFEADALIPLPMEHGELRFKLSGEPTPVRAKRVWFAVPEGLEPGYYLEIEVTVGDTDSRYHSFVVSGRDGALLYEKNLTADFDYRVWADSTGEGLPFDGPHGNDTSPHPAGSPNGFQPPFTAPALVTRDYGPISTMDPWLSPTATRTEGNNTFAYADIAGPNGFGAGDLSPAPTAAGVFDRTYDVTLDPDANPNQRLAATTQLFYDVNFFHDWYYDRGFDEAAGNAQTTNFGRGGLGNDAISAEAQDYSGRSNANMSTPSDGARPRMQMYVFDGLATERLTVGASNLPTNAAGFGPQTYNVTADVVLVNDADPSGTNGSISDGCQVAFVSSVTGKIALIDRGNCTFAQKVVNAQANGAVGVIIADINMSTRPPDLVGTPMPNTLIPAMSITRGAGMTVRSGLGQAAPVSATLFRTATVDRDGTLDNAIIAHEWGHYISNRLIGDGNGLSAQQSVGMGEGWGDFHALLMMVRADDLSLPSNTNWTGTWAVGGYTTSATSTQGHYYGVRRLPYSVDFAKNALTFKHIQQGVALPVGPPTSYGRDGSSNAEVHSTGEVWASMLWECYVALLRDTPRLTFAQAQDRMMRYLVAAYKLTPVLPTFVEARDALLAAAVARDPQDFALFWGAFARRGLGMQARAPDRDARDNRPAVESFMVGNAVAITDLTLDDSITSCDMDGQLDTDEVGALSITVKNVGVGVLSNTAVNVSTTSPGLSFPQGAMAAVPALAPFGSATVKVQVTLRGVRGFQGVSLNVSATDPSLALLGLVSREFRARLNSNLKPNGTSLDDVEAPSSRWTAANDPSGNTGSDWRISQASATSHWWFGPNPSSPADTYLVSPPLTGGTGPVTLTFKHRYEFEADATTFYDGAVLELSTDGRTWRDVGASAMPGYPGAIPNQTSNPLRGRRAYVGTSPNYPTFNTETVDLGSDLSGQTFRVRFRIGSDDAAAKKGWEVDDLQFTGLSSDPFTSVAVDLNICSGNRAPQLSTGGAVFVKEGEMASLTAMATDPDGDLVTITFTQKEGPMVAVTRGAFLAPQVERDTTLIFEVVATDGALESPPARLTVTVLDASPRPRVSVPPLVEVNEGDEVTITATGFDPQGTPVTFRWTQTRGTSKDLTGLDADTVRFTAPLVNEDLRLTFEVITNDGESDSEPAQVEVLVRDRGPSRTDEALGPLAKVGCGGCSSGFGEASFALTGALVLLRRRRVGSGPR